MIISRELEIKVLTITRRVNIIPIKISHRRCFCSKKRRGTIFEPILNDLWDVGRTHEYDIQMSRKKPLDFDLVQLAESNNLTQQS
jgi:hypothetical protein